MVHLATLEPVDYLIIGHLSLDLTPEGPRLGGSAAYSALTARSMGLRVGVVTAWGGEIPLDDLQGMLVISIPAQRSTTFENMRVGGSRQQKLHHRAPDLTFKHVPEAWRRAQIVHLAPIAQELPAQFNGSLSPTLLGLTPQGWLRSWDESGHVLACPWPDADQALAQAGAAVLSIEDVDNNEDVIEAMSHSCRILAVTEGPAGARLYWNGDLRRFRAPVKTEADATGAGDIFAAAFFIRLVNTRDPWEAARFATSLAASSVVRAGLEGIPTPEEIQAGLVEVLS